MNTKSLFTIGSIAVATAFGSCDKNTNVNTTSASVKEDSIRSINELMDLNQLGVDDDTHIILRKVYTNDGACHYIPRLSVNKEVLEERSRRYIVREPADLSQMGE